MLLDLLQEPSLAELWRGQLGPAGGHAVGGHAAWVLADAAALAIQCAANVLAESEQAVAGVLGPLRMLRTLCTLQPEATTRLARHAALLRTLSNAAGSLANVALRFERAAASRVGTTCRPAGSPGRAGYIPEGCLWDACSSLQNASSNTVWQLRCASLLRSGAHATAAGAFSFCGPMAMMGGLYKPEGPQAAVWRFIHQLAPHLPLAADRRAALQRQLAAMPCPSSQPQLAAAHVLIKVVMPDAHSAEGLPQPEAEAVLALAQRRAHALGTRRACASPVCASLAGSSEADSAGRRCSGCKAVRFCSEACSRTDWSQHKCFCKTAQRGNSGPSR